MEADAEAQLNAGLRLIHLWRGLEEPNTAFFVLEVDSVEKARAFLNPEAVAEASRAAGVLWHFIENVEGYSVQPPQTRNEACPAILLKGNNKPYTLSARVNAFA